MFCKIFRSTKITQTAFTTGLTKYHPSNCAVIFRPRGIRIEEIEYSLGYSPVLQHLTMNILFLVVIIAGQTCLILSMTRLLGTELGTIHQIQDQSFCFVYSLVWRMAYKMYNSLEQLILRMTKYSLETHCNEFWQFKLLTIGQCLPFYIYMHYYWYDCYRY